MKKLLLGVLLLGSASLSFAVQADFAVPIGVNNVADPGLKSAGVDICRLVTSSNAALVVDNAGDTITDGFIHWVIVPATGALGSFLELRATNTANLTSSRLTPWFAPTSTAALITTPRQSPVYTFDPPIPFSGGLSVNTLPAGSGGSVNGMDFAVGVRWKKQ